MKKILLKKSVLILVGALLYAASISLFLDPNKIAPGGASGIAIMISHFTGLGVGTLTFLINIPILVAGWIKLGRSFLLGTAAAIFLSSAFTDLSSGFNPVTDNAVLAALAGGVLLAAGLGLIFKAGCTTGGTDIIVRILKLRYRHLKTGTIFLIVDGIISVISGFVFSDLDLALCALLSLVVSGFVLDKVLYGSDEAKLVYIITDKETEVKNIILNKLDVGATLLNGHGAYSNADRNIILCAVKKQLLPKLQELVLKTDENSFMIITSANEIYGEGFKLRMNDY